VRRIPLLRFRFSVCSGFWVSGIASHGLGGNSLAEVLGSVTLSPGNSPPIPSRAELPPDFAPLTCTHPAHPHTHTHWHHACPHTTRPCTPTLFPRGSVNVGRCCPHRTSTTPIPPARHTAACALLPAAHPSNSRPEQWRGRRGAWPRVWASEPHPPPPPPASMQGGARVRVCTCVCVRVRRANGGALLLQPPPMQARARARARCDQPAATARPIHAALGAGGAPLVLAVHAVADGGGHPTWGACKRRRKRERGNLALVERGAVVGAGVVGAGVVRCTAGLVQDVVCGWRARGCKRGGARGRPARGQGRAVLIPPPPPPPLHHRLYCCCCRCCCCCCCSSQAGETRAHGIISAARA